jgi:AcrR family transcriptional regulator
MSLHPLAKAQTLEWVRPPQQARSQQTLERLLDAAEALIEDKGLDNATVSEIAKRAGSSVGAFYSRFSDKEGLMRCLFERFHEQAIATAEAVLVPERWHGIPIEHALEALVAFMLHILRERRGLIVALLARAAGDPELGALGETLHEHLSERLLGLIELRGERTAHPDPDTAVHIAVWMVVSAIELRTLYTSAGQQKHPDELVAREVARMCTSYLGLQATPSRRGERPEPTPTLGGDTTNTD